MGVRREWRDSDVVKMSLSDESSFESWSLEE